MILTTIGDYFPEDQQLSVGGDTVLGAFCGVRTDFFLNYLHDVYLDKLLGSEG
jgi:hypothetical protein